MAIGQPTNTISQRQLFADIDGPLLSHGQQTSVQDRFAAVTAAIEQVCTTRLDELPSVPIDSLPLSLPHTGTCVYFIVHPTHRILYVGRANDIWKRWDCDWNYFALEWMPKHHRHQQALNLGGCSLAWLESEHYALLELLLIKAIQPPWNKCDK